MTVIGIDLRVHHQQRRWPIVTEQVRMIPSFEEYLTPVWSTMTGRKSVGKIAREKWPIPQEPANSSSSIWGQPPNYPVQTGLPTGKIVSLCPQISWWRTPGAFRSDGDRSWLLVCRLTSTTPSHPRRQAGTLRLKGRTSYY